MFYIIEFFKSLNIKDYIFIVFMVSPFIAILFLMSNEDILKKNAKIMEENIKIEEFKYLYTQLDSYYFRSTPNQACSIFKNHVVSYHNYQAINDDLETFSCSQEISWDKNNITISYIAMGTEDNIHSIEFSFSEDMYSNPLFKGFWTSLLKDNFNISDTVHILDINGDGTLNLSGYTIDYKNQEKQMVIKFQ
jgi:hypothetical protein